jgi:type VI secretion system protein ImpE
MDAKELFRIGQLDAALAAATEDVKRRPADVNCRWFLCELLCFTGDLDRADKHLDALCTQDSSLVVSAGLFRRLLRAEQDRRDFFDSGRVPEFLEQPSEGVQRCVEASICLREGKPAEAARLLDEAEKQRLPVAGVADGQPFDDLRDLDDLTASVFEILGTNGKYYWVPTQKVESVEFRRPECPRDLLWRPARMAVRGGPDGEVHFPVLYHRSHLEPDDKVRLGRYTDWRGGNGAPVSGVGQRSFLVGETDHAILDLQQITFAVVQEGA